jgi:hypothetical protein
MPTTNIRFLHQETTVANIGNVQNTQSFITSDNDADLGYRVIGFVDGAGTARRLCAKDQDARFADMYLLDADHGGTNLARLVHAADTDTYLEFQADQIILRAGGVDMITLAEAATDSITLGANLYVPEYIYHVGDTDTFFRFQTDQIDFEAGGVNFINITEDGTQDLIEFNNANADVDFIVNASGIADVLKIEGSSGNVTINEAGADVDFRVESDAITHAFFVQGSDGFVTIGSATALQQFGVVKESGSTYAILASYSATSSHAGTLELYHARGTQATPTATQSGDILGSILFEGWDNDRAAGAEIRAVAAAEWGGDSSDAPAYLSFLTCPDGSDTLAERLRITSDGNVGFQKVPESTLSTRLSVWFGGNAGIISTKAEGASGLVYLTQNAYLDSAGDWKRISTDEVSSYLQANGGHRWYGDSSDTADDTYTPTERMRLTDTGRLSVGTASASALVDLVGDTSSFDGGVLTLEANGTAAFRRTEIGTYFRPVHAELTTIAAPASSVPGQTDWHGLDILCYGSSANVTANGKFYPFESTARWDGTDTIGGLVAGYLKTNNTDTGTVSLATGLRLWCKNDSTGTITDLRHISIEDVDNDSGTVDVQYGLYIAAMSNATANWGIYNSADSFFGGSVGIGTTAPDAKLDVLSTTEQLRLTYTDGSVYSAFTVDSNGNLKIAPTGGVVSIGATPSVWWTGGTGALQVGSTASVSSTESGFDGFFSNNAYFDNTDTRWEYQSAHCASQIDMAETDGSIEFKCAASGSANGAITWATPFKVTQTSANMLKELLYASAYDAGNGGTSGAPESVDPAGYNVVEVTPVDSTNNNWTVTAGNQFQTIRVVNTSGAQYAYVNGFTISVNSYIDLFYFDSAWRGEA